jgi:capsular polysaccharide transport system permease protein
MLKHFKLPRMHQLIAARSALFGKQVALRRGTEVKPPDHGRQSSEYVLLRPLRAADAGEAYDLYGGVPRRRRWTDFDGFLGWGMLVALPVLCGVLYFGLIAADRFVSQSEFIVRNTESSGAGRLASMVSAQSGAAASTGASVGDSDSQVVVTFMKSHDGMSAVDRSLGLRKLFARDEADFVMAYPGLFSADSEYRLKQYFSRMVDVDFDPLTGVIKLTTQAFRSEDAKAIADQLLSAAESLVNRMNIRAREDAIRAATEQVSAAHKEVLAAQEKLTAFRLREKMIDPVAMSGVVVKTIAELATQSVALKAQLSDLTKSAPASAQVAILRNQIASIEEQIARQQRQLAGPDGSMAPVLAEYQQLSLQREFADRIYTVALEQAEVARLQAARQHVFIERISGPTLADYAVEPRRLLLIFLVIVVAMSLFGTVRWIARDSRAHHGR